MQDNYWEDLYKEGFKLIRIESEEGERVGWIERVPASRYQLGGKVMTEGYVQELRWRHSELKRRRIKGLTQREQAEYRTIDNTLKRIAAGGIRLVKRL